jgi:amidase
VAALLDQLVETLRAAGATVVDPVEIEVPDEAGDAEYEVLLYEFKADLESYLRTAGVDERLDTLAELIDFNRRRAAEVMPWFGQEVFEAAAEKGPLTDEAYLAAFETSTLAMRRALDAALDRPASDGPASEGRANEGPASRAQPLDAIVAPTNGPAWPIDWVSGDRFSLGSSQPAATSGYPSISLPMGDIHGLPIGVSIVGRPWSEPRLIGYAYALESRLAARREPAFVETLEVSVPPD